MEEKQIKSTFSEEVTEQMVKKFLESENMQIKKVTLIPTAHVKTSGAVQAHIVAYVKEGLLKKAVKFYALFNNYEFQLYRQPINTKDEINLYREWQRFLLKNFGKDYVEYHEHRTDMEIESLKTQMQIVESNKNFQNEELNSNLKNRHEILARKIMQLKYERTF